jgi:hypothetical protein
MKSLLAAAPCLALSVLAAGTVSAAEFSYDGSSTPDSPTFGPTFTTVVFGHTDWGSDGNVLTMNTAFGEGIWFGAGYAYGDNPAWNLADNTTGNSLSLRARVSADGTEWSAYLADGSQFAGLTFNNTSVQYQTATALVTYPLDGTQFHTYGFLLKGGNVTYLVDGTTVYSGPSVASTGYIGLVGDGSATTISGTGSFYLDYATWDNTPVAPVPEPEQYALITLLACAGFAGWRRWGR